MSSIPIDVQDGPQVVLELIYRLKVKDIMTSSITTATPEDSFRTVQRLMRERRITGVPVVEDGRLAGLVSIHDIITALDGGWIEAPVSDYMTRSVIVLEDDMPLTFAITYLNRYGYGRFPVLDKDRKLVGIITATDIIRALLVQMNREVEKLEARLVSARSGETVPDGSMRLSFPTMRFDFETAGHASSELKKALKGLGVDSSVMRRAAIASYELELNQVIHSWGGIMEFTIDPGRIEIVASDTGPGIPDVAAALEEGFSTANEWIRSLGFGAGLGLPNAKRSADEFSIESGPSGTVVRAAIRR